MRQAAVSVIALLLLTAIVMGLSGCNGTVYVPDGHILVGAETDRATLELALAVASDDERITAYEWKIDGSTVRLTDRRITVPLDRSVVHDVTCSVYLRGSTTGIVVDGETYSDRDGGVLWKTFTAVIPVVSNTSESTADQI